MKSTITENQVLDWAGQPREKGKLNVGAGLYLEQRGARGRKVWKIRVLVEGTAKDVKIGTFPELNLGQAKEAADAARALSRQGRNPVALKKTLEVFGEDNLDGDSLGSAVLAFASAQNAHLANALLQRFQPLRNSFVWKARVKSLDEAALSNEVNLQRIVQGEDSAVRLAEDLAEVGKRIGRNWSIDSSQIEGASRMGPVGSSWTTGTFLSPRQLGMLLRSSERGANSWQVILVHQTLAYGLLRPAQAHTLTWEQLDLDAGLVRLQPLSSRQAIVDHPLPPTLVNRLKALSRHSKFVFFDPRHPDRSITQDGVKKMLQKQLNLTHQFSPVSWRRAFECWFDAHAATLCLDVEAGSQIVRPEQDAKRRLSAAALQQTINEWAKCLDNLKAAAKAAESKASIDA